MTRHRPCPAAPGPLEEYAARFDDLFSRLAQRRGFRGYLAGLLAGGGGSDRLGRSSPGGGGVPCRPE